VQHVNDSTKHVQEKDFVDSDSCISIQELQSDGKLAFSITLLNEKYEKYTREYSINIKGDDKLQVIIKDIIHMFIKGFMNSAKEIGQKIEGKKAKEVSLLMMDIIIQDLNLTEKETIKDKRIEIGC